MTEAHIERASGEPAQPGHAVRIEVGSFGPWETNAYLVWDGRSTDALVLDPGKGAAAPLVERVTANGLRLHLIADSHGHIDHIFDNAPLKRASGAPLAIHPDDEYRLSAPNAYGFEVEPSTADRHLREGEQLRIGDLVFDILHTPGHTEGSVCLYEESAWGCCSRATRSSPVAGAAPISPAATTSRWSPRSLALPASCPPVFGCSPATAPRPSSSGSCTGCVVSPRRAA